jgi:hypothetical protein
MPAWLGGTSKPSEGKVLRRKGLSGPKIPRPGSPVVTIPRLPGNGIATGASAVSNPWVTDASGAPVWSACRPDDGFRPEARRPAGIGPGALGPGALRVAKGSPRSGATRRRATAACRSAWERGNLTRPLRPCAACKRHGGPDPRGPARRMLVGSYRRRHSDLNTALWCAYLPDECRGKEARTMSSACGDDTAATQGKISTNAMAIVPIVSFRDGE